MAVPIVEKYGCLWNKHKAKTNELYILKEDEDSKESSNWYILVQDNTAKTIFLGFHASENRKKSSFRVHIKTTPMPKKLELRLFENKEKIAINENKNHNRDDYSAYFSNCTFFVTHQKNKDKLTKIDPDMAKYLGNFEYNENNFNNKENNKMAENDTPVCRNQILYGPPGTGKTYNTIIKAMEIIDSKAYENPSKKEYENLQKRFNDLKKQGRIEFVTFHQSYSYEEFVEGIKPEILEWGNNESSEIKYTGKDGIFKNIAKEALFEKLQIEEQTKQDEITFQEIKDKFQEKYQIGSKIEDGNISFKIVDYYGDKSIRINPDGAISTYSISWEPLKNMLAEHRKSSIVNRQDFIKRINSYKSLSSYYLPVLHKLAEFDTQKDDTSSSLEITESFKQECIDGFYEGKFKLKNDEDTKSYILIIDEINRGNISKIFGELITLIEEDKRETLSVKLPYSNKDFTVPKNLYIIGTMNTSDRSIASVDIALRRRFKFVEMMPKSNLVADFGTDFKTIFNTLNQRISILLDRDHQIGHSYFIKDKYENASVSTLKQIWFNSIIPLLNEYFYNDWEKLNLVIPGFINEIKVPTELKDECADEHYYEFRTIKDFKDDNEFKKALIVKPKKNSD